MSESVRFDRRFQGFTDGALGGYAAGVAARGIDGPAEANLRALPPLERDLSVERDGERVELRDGETVVVDAAPTEFRLAISESVDLERAGDAASRRPVAEPHEHLYPHCFTCGPGRRPDDGLNVFVGHVEDRDGLLAGAWTPDPAHADAAGALPSELVWAALDCPAIWASGALGEPLSKSLFRVLARQRVEIVRSPRAGEPCVVSAWPISRDDQKFLCGAAIHDRDGDLLARSDALLIEVAQD